MKNRRVFTPCLKKLYTLLGMISVKATDSKGIADEAPHSKRFLDNQRDDEVIHPVRVCCFYLHVSQQLFLNPGVSRTRQGVQTGKRWMLPGQGASEGSTHAQGVVAKLCCPSRLCVCLTVQPSVAESTPCVLQPQAWRAAALEVKCFTLFSYFKTYR